MTETGNEVAARLRQLPGFAHLKDTDLAVQGADEIDRLEDRAIRAEKHLERVHVARKKERKVLVERIWALEAELKQACVNKETDK